jgi:pyruvate, water dikinase
MLKHLRKLLPHRQPKPQRVSVTERFAHFRAIGAANDAFLRNLTALQQKVDSGVVPAMSTVVTAYEALSAPIGTMARSLVAMSGGRYRGLLSTFENLDRALNLEVLKARPIEFGPLIVWPADADALRAPVVGPKAARLAEVIRSVGVRVPPFFAVSVYGFEQFMEATGTQDLVNQMLWSSDLADSHSLRSFSDVVVNTIMNADVPPALARGLTEAYRALRAGASGRFGVAVRSSAVVEDAESSFAGQFESVLNVGDNGLLDAYKRVIASKYRPEALKYALSRGFLDEDVAMPVLVMAMVAARSAGVAYTRAPDRPECAMVTAVPGLAQSLVDGRVIPDTFLVEEHPPRVVEVIQGMRTFTLRCDPGSGVVEEREDTAVAGLALDPEVARTVARTAWMLERHFEVPQDVEWAIADDETLFVVQTRPLHVAALHARGGGNDARVEGYRVLLRDAARASAGVACGPVFRLADPTLADEVPEGAVLVVPITSPRLAGVIGRVAAVVAAAGSPTGHMATVAREFEVPCLVGAQAAMTALEDGQVVTVDGWSGAVYEGEVIELLSSATSAGRRPRSDAVTASMRRLADLVAPLTLTDPDSASFKPSACRTLHDIARFVHQRAMAEMFETDRLTAREHRTTKRMRWTVPMDLVLLDLGGGLAPFSGRFLPLEYVNSVPLLALIEGLTDSRLRWSGPVGFDLKGFMSVVVRSAADDQRYGEPSYALCASDYVHFSSRLAYHFATVDSVCGEIVNENYSRFLFFGGAAIAQRREWRAHFLAAVLRFNGFGVKHVGDRVEAVLPKRVADEIEDSLVMLGRLMVASRHLDMLMESRAAAEMFAQAFLAGDFGFESVRRRIGA